MVTYQLMNKDNVLLEFIKADTLEGQFKIVKEYENQTKPYLIGKQILKKPYFTQLIIGSKVWLYLVTILNLFT